VRARDLGAQPRLSTETAIVSVHVERNKNCPQFEGNPYSAVIDETVAVNGEVMQARANDFDKPVI
jgi:hypothetical protein